MFGRAALKFFTVHESAAPRDPDDRVVFVKEGWIWGAFAAPLLWLVYKRAWLGLGAYALAALTLIALMGLFGITDTPMKIASGALIIGFPALLTLMPSPFLSLIGLLFAALCAYEAGDVLRFVLARRGYRVAAVVSGKGEVEAEQAYFAQASLPPGGDGPWTSDGSKTGGANLDSNPAAHRAGRWASASEPILGLFPGPDHKG